MAYPPETQGGRVTSWVALTTSYPMSTPCSSYFRLDGLSLIAFDPAYGLDVDRYVTCEPAGVTSWWEQGLLGSGSGHAAVSIGPLTCPDGWETADSYVSRATSTQIMCCPSDYYLANEVASGTVNGNCLSDVQKGAVLTYGSSANTNTDSFKMATTTLTAASTVGAIAIVGWNIDQAPAVPGTTTNSRSTSEASSLQSHVKHTTTALSPTTLSHKSVQTSLPIPASSPSILSSTSPVSRTSSGMSSGLQAGIGVGAAVGGIGVISLIAAIIILLRRKRGSKDEGNNSSGDEKRNPIRQSREQEQVQHANTDMDQQREWNELDSTHFYEMSTTQRIGELDGTPSIGQDVATRSPVEMSDSHETPI